MTKNANKALLVVERDEIDKLIHGLEKAGIGYSQKVFQETYGNICEKLNALETDFSPNTNEALFVVDQDEIDTLIHGLEEAGFEHSHEEFQNAYSDIYEKLHAIETNSRNEFRLK